MFGIVDGTLYRLHTGVNWVRCKNAVEEVPLMGGNRDNIFKAEVAKLFIWELVKISGNDKNRIAKVFRDVIIMEFYFSKDSVFIHAGTKE